MGIVGIKSKFDKEAIIELDKLSRSAKQTEVKKDDSLFNGKDLLTDDHWNRLTKRNEEYGEKRSLLMENMKNLYTKAANIPLSTNDKGDNMLKIFNKVMANKTKVVGSTVFVFDDKGVASVPSSELLAYKSLLKQPGFMPFTGAIPQQVITKPVLTIEEAKAKGIPVVLNITTEGTIVEDKKEIEKPDEEKAEDTIPNFSEYYKSALQEMLDEIKIDHRAVQSKSTLIKMLEEAWQDEDKRVKIKTMLED